MCHSSFHIQCGQTYCLSQEPYQVAFGFIIFVNPCTYIEILLSFVAQLGRPLGALGAGVLPGGGLGTGALPGGGLGVLPGGGLPGAGTGIK